MPVFSQRLKPSLYDYAVPKHITLKINAAQYCYIIGMKHLALLIAFLLTAAIGFAQAKHTVTKFDVTYQIKNLGLNSRGTFGGLQADINFDKSHPDSSRIEASIDVNTLNSDNTMRDNHLKSEDYFDAARYPKIYMKSVYVKHKSGNEYTGTFNITIKDKTKELTMPFTYTENEKQGTFKGSFTIKRTDFGIGGKSMMMADDVKVSIEVQTTF